MVATVKTASTADRILDLAGADSPNERNKVLAMFFFFTYGHRDFYFAMYIGATVILNCFGVCYILKKYTNHINFIYQWLCIIVVASANVTHSGTFGTFLLRGTA